MTGVRLENRRADYSDSDLVIHKKNEDLWGGRILVKYQENPDTMIYGLISRGYKAGGVNSQPSLDSKDREFDTELMWNYEAGVKALG